MAKDTQDNVTKDAFTKKLELTDIEAKALQSAIRTQIKSHERAIRLHQTQGRNTMAEIYLEEGKILQSILIRV